MGFYRSMPPATAVRRSALLRFLMPLTALAASLIAAGGSGAAPNPLQAHTSDEVRQLAVRGIPLDKLTPEAQERVEQVVANTSVFRRMPVRVIDCDPEMYLFLLRQPDVVVSIWRVLGVTQLEARQLSPGRFAVADRAGASGTLEVLYASPEAFVFLADGRYEGPLSVRPTKGKCLLVLKSGYVRDSDGRCCITARLDSFLSLEPGAAEALTKILQSVVGKVADNNFTQSVTFVGSFSRTAEVNPQGVRRLSRKLLDVPAESRDALAAISDRLGAEYANATASVGNTDEPAPLPTASRARDGAAQVADRPHAAQE